MGRESKSYPATWDGRLVLACRKCQKKMKKAGKGEVLKGLKKAAKGGSGVPLHVLNVPCMDLCPKDGVAVCVPEIAVDRLIILWSESDLDRIITL